MAEVAKQQPVKTRQLQFSAQATRNTSPAPTMENGFKSLLEKTPIPFQGLLVSRILEQGGFYPNPGYRGPTYELLITREEYLIRSFELKCDSVVKAELEMFLKSGGIEYEKQSLASFCLSQADRMFEEYKPFLSPDDYQRFVNSQAKIFTETLCRTWTPLLEQCREELKKTPHTDPEQALGSLFAARAAEIFAAQAADKYQLEPQALTKRWAAVLGESEGEAKDQRKLTLTNLAKKLWEEKLTVKQQEAVLREVTGLETEMLENGLSVLRAAQLAISSTREERGMMATLAKTFFNSSEGFETLERDQGRFAAVSTRIESARAKLVELKELNQCKPMESFSQLNMLCSKASKDNVFFSLDEAFQEYAKFEFGPVELQTAALSKGILLPLGDALAKHPKTTVAVVGATTVAAAAVPEVTCPVLCIIAGGSFVYNGSRSLILAQEALRDSRLDLLYGSAGHAGAAAVDAAVFVGSAVASRNALLRMSEVMEAEGLSVPQYFKMRWDRGISLANTPARWVGNKLAQLKSLDDAMILSGQPGGATSPGGGYGVGYTSTPRVNLEPYTMTGQFGSPEVARTVMLPGQGIVSTVAPNTLLSGGKGSLAFKNLSLKAVPYSEGAAPLGTAPMPEYSQSWGKLPGNEFGAQGGGGGVGGGTSGVGAGARGVAGTANKQPVLVVQPGAQPAASPTGIKALLNGDKLAPGLQVDFHGTTVTRPGNIVKPDVGHSSTIIMAQPPRSNAPASATRVSGNSAIGSRSRFSGAFPFFSLEISTSRSAKDGSYTLKNQDASLVRMKLPGEVGITLPSLKVFDSRDCPPEVRASNKSPEDLGREITEMLRNRQFYGVKQLLRTLTPQERDEILRLYPNLRSEIADCLENSDRDLAEMLIAADAPKPTSEILAKEFDLFTPLTEPNHELLRGWFAAWSGLSEDSPEVSEAVINELAWAEEVLNKAREWWDSGVRRIAFDHDGTLSPFPDSPSAVIPPRPLSKYVLSELKKIGFELWILSGRRITLRDKYLPTGESRALANLFEQERILSCHDTQVDPALLRETTTQFGNESLARHVLQKDAALQSLRQMCNDDKLALFDDWPGEGRKWLREDPFVHVLLHPSKFLYALSELLRNQNGEPTFIQRGSAGREAFHALFGLGCGRIVDGGFEYPWEAKSARIAPGYFFGGEQGVKLTGQDFSKTYEALQYYANCGASMEHAWIVEGRKLSGAWARTLYGAQNRGLILTYDTNALVPLRYTGKARGAVVYIDTAHPVKGISPAPLGFGEDGEPYYKLGEASILGPGHPVHNMRQNSDASKPIPPTQGIPASPK